MNEWPEWIGSVDATVDIMDRIDRARELEHAVLDFAQQHGLTFQRNFPLDQGNEGAPPEVLEELRDRVRWLVRACLALNESYRWLQYSEILGDTDGIRARIARGICTEGRPHYDLYQATLDYGTDAQRDDAVRQYVPECGEDSFWSSRLGMNLWSGISTGMGAYMARHAIPNVILTPESVSGAGELHACGYDLAVGMATRGTAAAATLEVLGTPARYAEWHGYWKVGPRWKPVGADRSRIHSAARILVCEHDIHTGATLAALRPFIDRLNPEQVDVHLVYEGAHGLTNDARVLRDHVPSWTLRTHRELRGSGNVLVHARTILQRLRELGCLPPEDDTDAELTT